LIEDRHLLTSDSRHPRTMCGVPMLLLDGHPHDAIPPGVRVDLASCAITYPLTTRSARKATCPGCIVLFDTWSALAKGRTRPPDRAELEGWLTSPPAQRLLDAECGVVAADDGRRSVQDRRGI
jgi:hypothetical protein